LDTAEAADKAKKEKCYGISPAGQNDCANLAVHTVVQVNQQLTTILVNGV